MGRDGNGREVRPIENQLARTKENSRVWPGREELHQESWLLKNS
jgi:hypothetical protein